MDEVQVAEYWQAHPCGEQIAAGASSINERFFESYDQARYALERHILPALDQIDFCGRDVLEVGLGQGADSEQIIRRGGQWSGLDITAESVARVRTRLALKGLSGDVRQGSVTEIPWPDNSFDIVFSHGVLHHVPNVEAAQRELHRVLRPNGELILMLYARRSLNYQVSIRLLRRFILLLVYPLARLDLWKPSLMLSQHVENAQELGLFNYLRMGHFIHSNTDGPRNPFTRVYSRRNVHTTFSRFEVIRTHQHFLHAPPLPVRFFPGESVLGWHLWVHLRPID